MTARTLAEDFHWLTDGCGRVWIVHDGNVAPCCAWPESEAPYYCFEPEPVPTPPKFQLGQWLDCGFGVGVVVGICSDGYYSIWLAGNGVASNVPESALSPHAPVLTDDQRTIQPGDTVRVIDVPVNAHGVPIIPIDGDKGKVAKVAALYLDGDGLVSCGFENWAGDYYLHNLERVEKGDQP